MRTLIILAHPNIEKSTINKYWIESLPKDHADLTVHSLYEEYPDGVIDVKVEQQLMEQHDRIILQFPLQWYSSPYLLKKWQDEVLEYGWAYGTGGDKLHGKELGIAVSTGGAAEAYQAGGSNQYTLSELLRPIQATSNLIGTKYKSIHTCQGSFVVTEEILKENTAKYLEYILQ